MKNNDPDKKGKDRYVYIWREQGIANSGLPFYVGIGTHRNSTVHHNKYYRAYQSHLTTGHADTFAQRKANRKKEIKEIGEITWLEK